MSIRIGIIGLGSMGKGLVYQCSITHDMECIAVTDIDEKTREQSTGLPLRWCKDAMELVCDPDVDVVIDATTSIKEAAEFDAVALQNKKVLVMMNAEADLMFGPYFLDLARKNGTVYTSCDGDQHTVISRLISDVRTRWRFDLIMAGNMKGFLDLHATPNSIADEADKRGQDHIQCAAMTDGTKMSVEMALVANAFNLDVPRGGMVGPRAQRIEEALDLFDMEQDPFVDYLLGAQPGGGVFVIGYCEDEFQRSMLRYYKMGDGPYYLFYRPYHLCHIESMRCIDDAVNRGTHLLVPWHGMKTNVFAYAKKDLLTGVNLDGMGGFCCYGVLEEVEGNSGVPVCLLDNVQLVGPVKKDQKIRVEDIRIPDRVDFATYKEACMI